LPIPEHAAFHDPDAGLFIIAAAFDGLFTASITDEVRFARG